MSESFESLLIKMAETPAGPEDHHQEGSVLQHTIKAMNALEEIRGNDPEALLAALFHDVGKISTPEDELPHHYDHDELGAELIDSLGSEVLTDDRNETVQIVARQHMRFNKLPDMRASKVIRLVEKIDSTRISAETMVDLIEADRIGREPALDTDRKKYETRISAVREADTKLNDVDIANEQHRLQKKIELYREILNDYRES